MPLWKLVNVFLSRVSPWNRTSSGFNTRQKPLHCKRFLDPQKQPLIDTWKRLEKNNFCCFRPKNARLPEIRVSKAQKMLISSRVLSSIYQHFFLSVCSTLNTHKNVCFRELILPPTLFLSCGEWWRTHVTCLHHHFDYTCLKQLNKRENTGTVVRLKLSWNTKVFTRIQPKGKFDKPFSSQLKFI